MNPTNNIQSDFIDLYCFKKLGIYDKEEFQQKYLGDCVLIQNFLRRYFSSLGLNVLTISNIFQFANMLAYMTMKLNICVQSNPSSCCAGILHIIALSVPELDIIDKIESCCEITKGTYLRFSQTIIEFLYSNNIKYKRLRRKLNWLFHLYKINKPYSCYNNQISTL